MYVMDERTPPELVNSYMQGKFRSLSTKDRLLFYFSGAWCRCGGIPVSSVSGSRRWGRKQKRFARRCVRFLE